MRLRSKLAGVALALASVFALNQGLFALGSLGGSAFPLTFITQPVTNVTDAYNEILQTINAQTVGISTIYSNAASVPPGGVDTSPVTFSTSIQGNPLVQMVNTNTPTDVLVSGLTSSALTYLVASEAGRTIYPTNAMIMVSGTAATATGLALECGDGTLIASWPIAELVHNTPVGLYASTAGPALGTAFTKGCPASKGIAISNVGTNLTTTTQIYTNITYTVQ